jgi:hypothetical protein
MRRLSVGAALSKAGSQYSAQHWSRSLESPLLAAVSGPKHFLKKVIERLLSRAQNDGAVLPFARAALYQDGLLAALPSYKFSAARLALHALAGTNAARKPSFYPGRHSTSFAGRNQERSKLCTAGLFARASCASGPWVKRPWQERSSECFSWAWPMWRTVVATSLRPIPNTTFKKNTERF